MKTEKIIDLCDQDAIIHSQAKEIPMTQRPNIPDTQFYSEGHTYSITTSLITNFWRTAKFDEIISTQFSIECNIKELVLYKQLKQMINEKFGSVTGSFVDDRNFYLTAPGDFLVIVKNDNYRTGSVGIASFVFELYGNEHDTVEIQNKIQDLLKTEKLVKISWYYKTARGNDCASLHVTGLNQTLHDEFYPWLPNGVDEFIKSYYTSSASVLVMYGPPGTGKTSFLRHLLLSQSINAMVTYDDRVLKDDAFFVNYLTDDEHNALIVEDADLFLAPREDGDNDMMSKFLNVSDGLIKIMNKKMIFTTNINQVTKIDPALLRPGRCFGAVEFRELTSKEAQAAAAVAGLEHKDWNSQNTWSLAQIFTQTGASSPKFKMGFG